MNFKACLVGFAAAVLVGVGVAAIADDATTQPSATQATFDAEASEQCAHNLRQIGQLIAIYASEYKLLLPPNLAAVGKIARDYHIAVFVCPSSGTTIPADWDSMPADQKEQWINSKSDYVYLGRETRMNQIPHAAQIVLVYERGDNPHQGMMNLLFVDGHVESMDLADAHRVIEASKTAFEK
jgi:prepilin-type processing-associated H-X9-DG protein